MEQKTLTPQDFSPPAIIEEVVISWEELNTRWLELRENDDSTQIASGKLAIYTKRHYGKDGVVKMAIECNIAKSTISERMKVVETFDDDALAEFSRLSFSHLRLCARQKEPYLWAEQCMNQNWTVENLVMELGELKPEKVYLIEEYQKGFESLWGKASDNLNTDVLDEARMWTGELLNMIPAEKQDEAFTDDDDII